ncbi:MAG: motility protein A [Magnetospiraceae bacterium]
MANDSDYMGPRVTPDMATILGIVVAFGAIAIAIALGGAGWSFVNVQSVLIVLVGTIAVTTMCFSLREIGGSFGVVYKAFVRSTQDPAEAATLVLEVAVVARKQGILSLQGVLEGLRDEPLLFKGLSMVVDGTPGEEVEHVLRRDIQATVQRHLKSAGVLRKAADFAPAMGLIGTLIGLVQMLGNLDDPTTIGPSMAVALLTTFYGAVLANLVFAPLAAKLERNSSEEALISQLYLLGAASIGRQENPRRLEMLLNSILPPMHRIQFFD